MSVAEPNLDTGRAIVESLLAAGEERARDELGALVRKNGAKGQALWTKSEILRVLDDYYSDDSNYVWLRRVLTKRPIRSLSGVTTITALTKPFPCPGRCVFCPVDVRMPKSYIATEPGAQRAGRLGFDPYQQVTARLKAYTANGHPIGKIEFIVLGGTWSSYPHEYQRWFIKRMFDALNDWGVSDIEQPSDSYPTDWNDRVSAGESYNAHIENSQYLRQPHEETATQDELETVQRVNESADIRCVGLSLETRPDLVDVDECISLRSLGATKIQIGIQSLDDRVLRLNKRGHLVAKTRSAMTLLRQFGFKVHAHWMPNLYGSTAEADIVDYDRVFTDPSIRPDELKVYPTVLIQDTELEGLAAEGKWTPYSEEDLNGVLTHVLKSTPEYCRLTRIIRDIPSGEILAGNKKGNLRQIVENGIDKSEMHDIRAREVKGQLVDRSDYEIEVLTYDTASSTEQFLQVVRAEDRRIAGFTRLSLPLEEAPIAELKGAAIIREVHVYGQSLGVGDGGGATQHQGLGRELVDKACVIAQEAGFEEVAIISAVGTRAYYRRLGFEDRELYQVRVLTPSF